MQHPVKSQFKLQLALLGLAAMLGWALGAVAWALVLALAGMLLWHSWQLHRLRVWLRKSDHRSVPESRGVWGDLFDD
ncbi:MAG: DUF3329 domain-containing protein, partial [Motiliproteus sp.]